VTDVDTIVIGAGVAGLTAARLLAGAGRRVIVLEARDRVGGRLHSVRRGGDVLDYGASWIHGIDDNPLADAADAFGLRTTEFTVGSFQPDGRPIVYFSPTGARLGDDDAREFASDVHTVDRILAEVVADSELGTSYADCVETALSHCDWDESRRARVREYMQHRTEEQLGVCIDDLDAHGLDDDAISGDEVVFPDGYDELAAHLAEGLDVRLEHRATRISWSTTGGTVETDRGVFDASRIVVTVPIGVLKSPDFVIEPALPDPMARALDRLEMNAFEKVFLRFPVKFWDDGVYALRRQGDAGRWWHSWYDVSAEGGSPTLLTFAAGPCARATRSWSDARIGDSVLSALRELYGDAVVPPDRVDVTRWQDDPFSRGSYSYPSVGSTPADHDALSTPVQDVLHLAGEATWTEDPSTVTAAMRSGHRAAERILQRPIGFAELWSGERS
jgi:monoamine oxidase